LPVLLVDPQREILVDVLAGRGACAFLKPCLNLLEGLEGDEAFVMTFAQSDIPCRGFDMAGVDGTRQQLGDTLVPDLTIRQVLGIVGLAFEEALHLDLCIKAAAGEAFQGLLQD
jgi:hypothetical protein